MLKAGVFLHGKNSLISHQSGPMSSEGQHVQGMRVGLILSRVYEVWLDHSPALINSPAVNLWMDSPILIWFDRSLFSNWGGWLDFLRSRFPEYDPPTSLKKRSMTPPPFPEIKVWPPLLRKSKFLTLWPPQFCVFRIHLFQLTNVVLVRCDDDACGRENVFHTRHRHHDKREVRAYIEWRCCGTGICHSVQKAFFGIL